MSADDQPGTSPAFWVRNWRPCARREWRQVTPVARNRCDRAPSSTGTEPDGSCSGTRGRRSLDFPGGSPTFTSLRQAAPRAFKALAAEWAVDSGGASATGRPRVRSPSRTIRASTGLSRSCSRSAVRRCCSSAAHERKAKAIESALKHRTTTPVAVVSRRADAGAARPRRRVFRRSGRRTAARVLRDRQRGAELPVRASPRAVRSPSRSGTPRTAARPARSHRPARGDPGSRAGDSGLASRGAWPGGITRASMRSRQHLPGATRTLRPLR